MSAIVNLIFGLGTSFGIAMFLAVLSGFDIQTGIVYFCWINSIMVYCNLIPLAVFVASFILMVGIVIYNLQNKSRGGNNATDY